MSRIGKQIITIPEKTEVSYKDGLLSVKGPLGELKRNLDRVIEINIADGKITLTPKRMSNALNALWGTYASHIKNMMKGVNTVFERKLVVEGIGYKCDVKGGQLVLAVGFSHPVHIDIPKTLKVTIDKQTIIVSGINKEEVGQFASVVRSTKKPEPYKGKGIRYEDEVIRRKQGKKTA